MRYVEAWQYRRLNRAWTRLSLVPLFVLATACSSAHHASSAISTSASATTTVDRSAASSTTVQLLKGDAAVWSLRMHNDVNSGSNAFTALVSSAGCAEYVRHSVAFDASEIVITFAVAPVNPRNHCQSQVDPTVAVPVHLDQAVGNRRLLDGACLSGTPASTTSFCVRNGSVRWQP